MNARICRRLLITAARSRIVVALCLVGYLGATIGFPLPATVANKPGRPFPCQHHACGCASADQCWKSCCCFSPLEKLAWARANQVEPPEELLAELGELDHDHLADHDGHDCHEHASCEHTSCRDQAIAGTCASGTERSSSANASCCTQSEGGRRSTASACAMPRVEDPSHHVDRTTIVIGKLWRGCRGLSSEWLAGGIAPPPVRVNWTFQWDVRERFSVPCMFFRAGELAPPVPPPPQV